MNEIFIVYNWLFSLVVSLYKVLFGVPGVARGIKKEFWREKNLQKIALEFPQKVSAHSVQPFGQL